MPFAPTSPQSAPSRFFNDPGRFDPAAARDTRNDFLQPHDEMSAWDDFRDAAGGLTLDEIGAGIAFMLCIALAFLALVVFG
ncbi:MULTISPECIES: hypothetical protein [unclassified Acidocella]|uniref:hypothetical protein n=1 Tax=unclassified Acidocella TaxID=2648610 RepID=UPI000587B715|nr:MULTISPECIES: hypothetical protein [unclassified Acidocella]WBO60583.1 hypothetical protein GT370_07370 [Acidocella sp. MX-AZ03]